MPPPPTPVATPLIWTASDISHERRTGQNEKKRKSFVDSTLYIKCEGQRWSVVINDINHVWTRQRVISNQLAVVENLHESLKEMFFSRKKHVFHGKYAYLAQSISSQRYVMKGWTSCRIKEEPLLHLETTLK